MDNKTRLRVMKARKFVNTYPFVVVGVIHFVLMLVFPKAKLPQIVSIVGIQIFSTMTFCKMVREMWRYHRMTRERKEFAFWGREVDHCFLGCVRAIMEGDPEELRNRHQALRTAFHRYEKAYHSLKSIYPTTTPK